MHAPRAQPGPLDASILVEALRAHAGGFVAAALAVHAVLWTIVPLIGEPTPDPRIAVGLAAGRHWLLGYPGLPPLAPWVLHAVHGVVPSVPFLKALGPIAVALAGWYVFGLARRIAGDRQGALAALVMVGVYPVTFPVSALGSATIQMPLVAGMALAWWRAVAEKNPAAWLVFGIAGALAFYAGAQGVLVLALLLAVTAGTRSGRAMLRDQPRAPALTALVLFLLVAAPRLGWLAAHGFTGFYEDAGSGFGLHGGLDAYEALGAAFVGHLGLILLIVIGTPVLFAAGKSGAVPLTRAPLPGFAPAAVTALATVPVLLAGAAALALRMQTAAEAFAPLLLYSGLLAVVLAGDTVLICRQYLAAAVAAILLVLPPVLLVSADLALPWLGRGLITNWPAERAARTMAGIFQTRTGRPLAIVIGRTLLASEIALAAPGRPLVFPGANPELAPWIGDALRAKGAVVFWPAARDNAAPPAALTARLPPFVAEAPLTLPWRRAGNLDPVVLGWGIIPPAK
jgi:hypothetical protein